MHPGGQGETYKVSEAGTTLVLKVYRGQREGQLRLRELSDAFDMMADMPSSIKRARMVDCGSAYVGQEVWPASLFSFVQGKALYDPMGISECAVRNGDVPNTSRVKMAVELLEGVHYLHSKGIVHADLAPSNILVNDSISELTIIDVDGAGILQQDRTGWKRQPLVLGHGALPDFPAPSEYWDGEVFRESDYWWVNMLAYFILTSTPPFFFLTLVSPNELHETESLLRNAKPSWPPEYDLIRQHSRFNHRIAKDDYIQFANIFEEVVPSSTFFYTFVPGYARPKVRVPPGYLYRQLTRRL